MNNNIRFKPFTNLFKLGILISQTTVSSDDKISTPKTSSISGLSLNFLIKALPKNPALPVTKTFKNEINLHKGLIMFV